MLPFIGTDIVFIPKLKKIIDNNPAFISKIYTKKELMIAKTIKNPYHFYATRFAAKEAIIKALNGLFDFPEIEILKGNDGRPLASIINHPEYIINISLSFDNEYAIAYCIAKKK